MYVARKKKRLEEAEQEILEVIKRRDVLKAEVVAGVDRLAWLKTELAREASAPLLGPTDVGVCDEIAHLKARLVAAEEERDAASKDKPQCSEPAGFARTDHIPPMPSLVPAELSQWLLDRQSDLQETHELGGQPDLVLQLTSMLSDGAIGTVPFSVTNSVS